MPVSCLKKQALRCNPSRLATPPFGQFVAPIDLPEAAQSCAIEAHADGFEYVSLGPAGSDPAEWDAIPAALGRSDRVFLSGSLTTQQGELDLANTARCVGNNCVTFEIRAGWLRQICAFCALANVPACTPFFPAAYAQRDRPAFALALQAADLALGCFEKAKSLQEAQQCLIETVNANAERLEAVALKMEKCTATSLKGWTSLLHHIPTNALRSAARSKLWGCLPLVHTEACSPVLFSPPVCSKPNIARSASTA